MHAIKKVMQTFWLPVTKMISQMWCMSDDTVWVCMRESMGLVAQQETY